MLEILDLICRLLAMLGSSVRALIAHITIQEQALVAPNGLAYVPKGVRAHFDRAYVRCSCFVRQVQFGRLYETDLRVI